MYVWEAAFFLDISLIMADKEELIIFISFFSFEGVK